MTTAQSLWLTDRQRAEMRAVPLGTLGDNEVLIQSRFGAISRGTEALVANGGVPESEYERMRAPLQDGDFSFPVKYGYAVVGQVEAGPRERRGETVFCLHPHQDIFHAPADMAIRVPKSVPPSRAILAANMETALNAIWDAGIMAGDRVAIVGAGLLGLLVASLAAKIPATEVTVVDVNAARGPLAEIFGCRFATPEHLEELAGRADVVIHARQVPRAWRRRSRLPASRHGSSRCRGSVIAASKCRSAVPFTASACRSSLRRLGMCRQRAGPVGR